MKRSLLRPVAVGIATFSTVAGMVIGAVSSNAASVGTLTFSPATGIDATPLSVTTSAACPVGDGQDSNLIVSLSGPGFPAGGVNVVANTSQSIYGSDPVTGGLTVPLQNTIAHFASIQTPPVTLAGTYAVSVNCIQPFGTSYGTFDGTLVFTQNGANPASYVANNPVTNYTTTTAIAASPGAGAINTGVPVTYTAQVNSTPAGGATGTVQFKDGATAIGSPTAVDATGKATLTAPFTTAGAHSITAAFTGSAANVGNSVSPAVAYTVTLAPADATTTSLSISPATANSAQTVSLSATVVDNAHAGSIPVGSVQFADGGTALGTPVAVSATGTAGFNQAFAAGAHSFTATFTPTNANVFAASASTSQAYTVTAFTGSQATETIVTTVDAGALTISVANHSNVTLPDPVLNATASYLTTSGAINTVTVTDTRAGNPGWVASGQASDFVNTTGPTGTPIPAVDLGWTPNVVDFNPGQTIVAGAAVLPATAPLVADPATAGAAGLQVSRTLASAAAGAGTGTAHLGANLALNVPTTVVAGFYGATLTLTAI